MALFLDSASIEDATHANSLGFISGVTTNPALMSKNGGSPEASIKSPKEAVSTITSGAHHITLPLQVIMDMGEHPLSLQTIEEFDRAWKNQEETQVCHEGR